MTSHFGKFRGKVVDNADPSMQGRLTVIVPDVSENPLAWAMPCVPYAGPGVGFFALPPVGANVWVEFERGDPNYPIWTGCFWQKGQVPAKPAAPTTKMLKTETAAFEIDDASASVSLQVQTPAGTIKIEQSPDGITLTVGSASLKVSPDSIDAATPPSAVSVAGQGISLKSAATTIEMSPASIEIRNSAASVALSPASVSLNNGALEVI